MDSWNPMGGKEHNTVKGYGEDSESEKELQLGRVTAVFFLLMIIGTAIYSLARHPDVLALVKSLVMAIWEMLCNIANACSDFIEYLKH
jgi:hypothetical protein